ncbi:MAG: winged helix-turn-helix transcriptional regulator [Nanoarchaeota archaeon]|nr:winged helix-turn-helix transcriptional regulator [Nanoarchaeota archaeon]MBU1704481.1 winged helix-turn-helix transcriptional regulator [Nanoarchaeota archaeon]
MANKGVLLVFLLLLCVCSAEAAILHGAVYDARLRPRNDVYVEINSSPSQVFISKEGQYSFVLEPGSYHLNAYFELDGVEYQANENVAIPRNGYFVRDLVLESPDGIVPDDERNDLSNFFYYGLAALVVALAALAYVFRRRRPREIKYEVSYEEPEPKEEEPKPHLVPQHEDKYMNQVLEIIKKEDGRTTQKEIRKQMPMSEAKISLIISELEAKGVIKKIKKGRGNIITLNTNP